MTSVADFVRAVDAFMGMQKSLVLGSTPPAWQRGRDSNELRLKIPMEIEGEQRGQFLLISAFPEHPTLRFGISTQFGNHVVCRLDFDLNTTHGNNQAIPADGVPPIVHGPHWHSWELNRRFVRNLSEYMKLPNAAPYRDARKFDAALRWYCAERHVHIGHHNIELPARERLL